MKTCNFLLCFILISALSSLQAQVYMPVNFKNYNPIWVYSHKTDKIPFIADTWIFLEQNADKDNLVIDNGVLYNIYNIVFGPAWIGGYYLEAVDLTTGKLKWDNVYYSEITGERRFAQHPKIIGDTLEILIYEEFDTLKTLFSPLWFTAFPRRITFNKQNGDIFNSTFQIKKDLAAKKLPVPWPPAPTHLYYQDGDFIAINHLTSTDSNSGKSIVWYNRFVINQNGKVNDSSEFVIQTGYNKILNTLNDLEDNNIFIFCSSEAQPDSMNNGFDLGFQYRDREMKIKSSGDLNIIHTGIENSFGPVYVSSDYFIMRADTFVEQPYFNKEKSLTLFDNKGSIIEKLDISGLIISSDNIGLSQATLIQSNSGPRILFCVNTRINNALDFYLSDGTGQFKKTNSFQINQETKTGIYLNKIQRVGDNVLCYFIYRETATRLDPAPLWSSWALFKGEDLGILTSNKDVSLKKQNKLQISPNPVFDMLKINFNEIISGKLYIYNCDGQLIFSKDIKGSKEYYYNAKQLLDGKYSVQFFTNNKVLNAQFIKVN